MDGLRIAIYMRVSKEEYCTTKGELQDRNHSKNYRIDEGERYSNSIINQKKMIEQYILEHFQDYTCMYYEDDGYTGMNYNRPGFSKLLQDAFAEKIDIIIVKDLSRLGREYIETGKYIKRIWPSLNIRFISINDDYDSKDASISQKHLIMPIKSFINECYSRDISRKVRTNLDVMRKNGQYVGAYVAYGYKKADNNINKIEVDRNIAPYIRLIYTKFLQGYSIGQIQKMLDDKGVMTPYRYKKMLNDKYYSGYVQKGDKWVYSTVSRILKNEIYIGNMIQGKRTTLNYKIRKCVYKEEQEWVRVVDNHEAIISQEVFYGAQRRMKADNRNSNKNDRYILSGILWCRKCGNLMVRRTSKSGVYYICSEYNRSGKCVRNSFKEELLIDIVKYILHLIVDEIIGFDVANDFNKDGDIGNIINKCNIVEKMDNIKYYCSINIDKIYIVSGKEKIISIRLVEY